VFISQICLSNGGHRATVEMQSNCMHCTGSASLVC